MAVLALVATGALVLGISSPAAASQYWKVTQTVHVAGYIYSDTIHVETLLVPASNGRLQLNSIKFSQSNGWGLAVNVFGEKNKICKPYMSVPANGTSFYHFSGCFVQRGGTVAEDFYGTVNHRWVDHVARYNAPR